MSKRNGTHLALVSIFLLFASSQTRAQRAIEKISVSSSETAGNDHSRQCAISSSDGRYVAFSSIATNLGPGSDTNGVSDVFIRDRLLGTTVRVSESATGTEADGASASDVTGVKQVAISGSGRYVVFISSATNLVPGDTNNKADAFLRDRDTDANGTYDEAGAVSMTRVSVDSTGAQANNLTTSVAISNDGSVIAFASLASNLILSDTNSVSDVFVYASTQVSRVSVTSAGSQVSVASEAPTVSSNGRFVAFHSPDTFGLTDNTTGGAPDFDIFVRDRQNSTTARVSYNTTSGQELSGHSEFPDISDNGRYVVFWYSNASPLQDDIRVADRDSDNDSVFDEANTSVNVSNHYSTGSAVGGCEYPPAISADGNQIAFLTRANTLSEEQEDLDVFNTDADVILRPRGSGVATFITQSAFGQPSNGPSDYLVDLTAAGDIVAFSSSASSLVPSDTTTSDVFVSVGPPNWVAFCFGDGSGVACPCGNSGSSGHGCAHSTNSNGAFQTATGIPDVSSDTFTLEASGMRGTIAIFLQNTHVAGTVVTFGDGLKCTTGQNTKRLGIKDIVSGAAHYPNVSDSDPPISTQGQIPSGGGQYYYQTYYRDSGSFCTGATFNITNGILANWSP